LYRQKKNEKETSERSSIEELCMRLLFFYWNFMSLV